MGQAALSVLIVLYATSGMISFIAYLPTLRDLLHGKSSANAPSYVLWSACNVIAQLYGIFILHDLLFNIVTALQLIACASILILRLRLPK